MYILLVICQCMSSSHSCIPQLVNYSTSREIKETSVVLTVTLVTCASFNLKDILLKKLLSWRGYYFLM